MDDLLSGTNAALAGAIMGVTSTLKGVFPTAFAHPVGQRLLPAIPLVLGAVAAVAGFCDPSVTRWQDRIVIGLLSGATAGQLFKVGRTTVAGKGVSLPEGELPPTPPTDPTGA